MYYISSEDIFLYSVDHRLVLVFGPVGLYISFLGISLDYRIILDLRDWAVEPIHKPIYSFCSLIVGGFYVGFVDVDMAYNFNFVSKVIEN